MVLFIVFVFCIESFGAVVSDNDGSAFITKAEFDSLKNNFQSQIDQYNTSIDSKIDGAIASYLSGISMSKEGLVSSLSDGIYWSIGPFERPRYKQGKCIYEIMQDRICWIGTSVGSRQESYNNLTVSWGDNFTQKREVENDEWAYYDLIVNNPSDEGGEYDGWWTNSSHFYQCWSLSNYQEAWSDQIANSLTSGTRLIGGAAGYMWRNYNTSFGSIEYFSFRPGRVGQADNYGNPTIGGGLPNLNGVSSYYSINKGSRLGWTKNITVFGPIDYHCFNEAGLDRADVTMRRNRDIRDEILWEAVTYPPTLENASAGGHKNQPNMFYKHVYDDAEPSVNPWNESALPGAVSRIKNAVVVFYSAPPANGNHWTGTYPISLGKGYGINSDGASQGWGMTKWLMPDVPFTSLTNYNQLGCKTDVSVSNYLSTISTNAILHDSSGNSLLSLAAGLPTCAIDKKKKVNIKGEIRRGCQISYNATTKTNTVVEGVVDTTNAYIVYAKLTPFDKTVMPEDETDLVDISPETKDTANVGKLTKCLIVRDGKVNFDITNDSSNDKVIFLKWEKLSNWTTAGTTRKTGAATNYDVRVIGSNTDEITPPTWTYFGGGFLKLDSEFKWQDAE